MIFDRLDKLEQAIIDNKEDLEALAKNVHKDHGLLELKFVKMDAALSGFDDYAKRHSSKHDKRK